MLREFTASPYILADRIPFPADKIHYVIKGFDQMKAPDQMRAPHEIRQIRKIGSNNEIMKVNKIRK